MTDAEDDDIEARIIEFYAENLAALQMERGYALSPEVKETALLQVLLYWRRLRDVAEKVTDTEVKLNLPEQKTPEGRKFGIEGVVDIVRERDRTVMYDIKTYDANMIRTNPEGCEKQLNVYAHIWQTLRGQPLDEMAVISTAFPDAVREAWKSGDKARVASELSKWDPMVKIPFDKRRIEDTIADFGRVVDKIEDGLFGPANVAKLQGKLSARKVAFAVDVCVNCDARFSCASYRVYATSSSGGRDQSFRQYYSEAGSETQHTDWVIASLDAEPRTLEDLE